MKKAFFIISLVLSFVVSGNLSKVFAVEVPNFPVCANPQGDVIASYDNGIHGVPGDTTQYTGKDTVYSVNENQLIQCLCTDNGAGIQTNWWKVSSLTEDQTDILRSEGWILIPNGSAWGLASSKYLAKNINFSCNPPTTSVDASTGGAGEGRSDGRSDGLGCASHDCSNQASSQGQVLGASTSVLGLATTGNFAFILSVLLAGMLALSIGLILRPKR